MGTLIAVAITLVAGAALVAFVFGETGVSESHYGGQVQTQINALGERFSFVNIYFTCGSPPCTTFTMMVVTVYNSGTIALTLNEITIQDSSSVGSSALVYQRTSNTAPTGCTGGIASAYNSVGPQTGGVAASISPPPSTNALTWFTLTLPNSGSCPISFSSGFISAHQYQVFAIGTNGYYTMQGVSKF